jgi:hypothetical protein
MVVSLCECHIRPSLPLGNSKSPADGTCQDDCSLLLLRLHHSSCINGRVGWLQQHIIAASRETRYKVMQLQACLETHFTRRRGPPHHGFESCTAC